MSKPDFEFKLMISRRVVLALCAVGLVVSASGLVYSLIMKDWLWAALFAVSVTMTALDLVEDKRGNAV